MNYTELVAALVAETNIEATNAGFVAILPTIIDQAEGMIYRTDGLDFLSSVIADTTGFTTPGQQLFTLPRFYTILSSINLVNGNDYLPLVPISREALNALYSSRVASSLTALPTSWAPLTDQTVLLGPTPGGTTQLECIGIVQPAPISASNPTTWLWDNLSDFAFAAAMFFMSGYMRAFGAQADDPKLAVSWKGVYDELLPGAKGDEMRRRKLAGG